MLFLIIKFQSKILLRFNNKVVQCSVVEAALMNHPEVVDCAAFAKQCPVQGEVPAAWVVLEPGVSNTDQVI
jgi:acyl-coenzyme A synthetase/AMP-(fatty) acid ligase